MSLSGKPTLTTAALIANDGFWPDLSLSELMAKYRIPAEYADETISDGLVKAMMDINDKLQPIKVAIKLKGFNDLLSFAQSLGDTINVEYLLILHYKRAVFSWAKADLLQQFNSLNRKADAENAAKEAQDTEQYWRDQAQMSIKAMFTTVLPDVPMYAKAGIYVGLV